MAQKLSGPVAVVAGATRGAGRGIACMLGEAGATVYCTGRSVKGDPSPIARPETIEETAAMVTSRGGAGIWARVDHNVPRQVRALFERVQREQGRLDILVNNMSGDQHLTRGMLCGREPVSFWDYPIEKGLATQRNGVHTHLITSHFAAPLMIAHRRGLIVEVTDGNRLAYNGVGVYYSLSKTTPVLLAYLMSEELKPYNVAVVSLTPGWLRSESMLDGFGVTEDNWQDVVEENPDFAKSETPFYIGRAVVALAADPNVMDRTGHALSAGYLAREYGFPDVDGTQPPGYAWGGIDIREGIFKGGRFLSLDDERVTASSDHAAKPEQSR
jgi:NAD(P)-dependent dehydrogenase (short-subunit alcohol dehydrogenase family)